VARIKYLLRQSDSSELKELAEKALMQSYGHKISSIVFSYLEEKGLAGLVRAGNK
jgi:phosphotransferase system enzyme I (PtsP)